MRREHLEEIAEVVREHNLLVLSDEIYGELTYGKESHVCFAEIEGMRERTVVVNGFLQNVRYDRLETWICGWPS